MSNRINESAEKAVAESKANTDSNKAITKDSDEYHGSETKLDQTAVESQPAAIREYFKQLNSFEFANNAKNKPENNIIRIYFSSSY